MRSILTLLRTCGALLLLLALARPAAATGGDTLTVAPQHYHVDATHHLILINQDVDGLNAAVPGDKRYLALGQVYDFGQVVTRVRTDSSYQVTQGGVAYAVYFTQLPVIRLSTRYQIADTPSVPARLVLTEMSGRQVQADLGIEYRGGSSQSFPKKSFELSFWADSTGAASTDVALLGMRTDNKYNLQALYNEPLRFRSKVANALWQDIHPIYYQAQEPDAKNGIAMEYAEVFVNGEYRGVYALSERIDRKQLKLKKYSNGAITGELYKGYDWNGATTFSWIPYFDNNSETWAGFEYKHPEERIDWTNLYNFCSFVKYSADPDFYRTYQQQFHLGNAVDYYLFLNLTRATDNTGKNLYIAKYKQGAPYYYVPWDLDGTFGTDWLGNNTGSVDDILSNGLYARLVQDCSAGGFRETLTSRWRTLRAGVITEQSIMARFRANYDYLDHNRVYAREQLVWGGTQRDTAQLAYIQTWLRQRLAFLDSAFNVSCTTLATRRPQTDNALLTLYPNPAHDYLLVSWAAADATPAEVSIRDLRGRTVLQTTVKGTQSRISTAGLARGLYAVTVRSATRVATQKLVVE